LRWEDVDLEAGVAVIAVQRTQVGRDVRQSAPKTKSGARALILDRGTVAVLTAHRVRQDECLATLEGAWVSSGLVFTMVDGRGIQPQYVTRLFARVCAEGGFPQIRLHDLRHTSASLGLAAGESLVEVSKRLGHSQLAITADTYTHVLPVVALASSEARAALIPRNAVAGRAPNVPTPGVASGDVPTSCPPSLRKPVERYLSDAVSAGQEGFRDAPPSGLEPETLRLTVACSAN